MHSLAVHKTVVTPFIGMSRRRWRGSLPSRVRHHVLPPDNLATYTDVARLIAGCQDA